METNRILQFRAIVETGNYRKASDLLGISHSGLSKSIQVLEAELGYSLFRPSGRGVVVSDEGKKLYERSSHFLNSLENLIHGETTSDQQVLKIGSFETFTTFFFGPLVKKHLANVRIDIHELVPGHLEEALVNEKVDLGITYEPDPQKGIQYIKVGKIGMAAYSLKDLYDGWDLAKIPFIAPVLPLEGAPSGVKGNDGWPEQKLKRNILYRVDLLTTGVEIVRQGLAALFIPKFVARMHNERSPEHFHFHPIRLPKIISAIKRDVFLVKRESSPDLEATRIIAKALRELCLED